MTRQTPEQRLLAKIKIDPTDPDACWVWTGTVSTDGYGPHAAVWRVYNGPVPAGLTLDHTCHVRHCVSPAHLRLATRKEQQENRAGAQRNSTSGIRGVHWNSQAGKWRVQVRHNRRLHIGGFFDDLDEAAEAARALRNQLFTHNDADRTEAE